MEIITELEDYEIQKYSRQFILPQIGPEGQIKIRNAKVLIVGMGGLGSPVLMYLVSAGVGTIGIIDHDHVELHNLQRQVIHNESFIGKSKVGSAMNFAKALNSNVNIITYNTKLSSENAESIISEYDIVLDCSDSVSVRYIINDFTRILQKDFIAASVLKWEGQLFVFDKNGPCYRCMFPEPNEITSNCNESGIVGPACGVIGSMQATEALKLILGLSEPTFIIFNLLRIDFVKFKPMQKKPCRACVDKKHLPVSLTCSKTQLSERKDINYIPWAEYMKDNEKYTLVDVRPQIMYAIAHFKSAINVPIKESKEFIKSNKNEKPLALLCKRGITACDAADLFIASGYDVVVIKGGIEEYKRCYNDKFPLI